MTTEDSENTGFFRSGKSINQIVFSALVVLAMIGIIITNISPATALYYWIFMLILYAGTSIYLGKKLASDKEEDIENFVLKQIIHWGASLVAILCVYTLLHTGRVNHEEAGLIMLLILSLSTFLAGSHVGWHFYLLGALLCTATIVIAYIEMFMWVIILVAALIVGGTYYWAKRKMKKED